LVGKYNQYVNEDKNIVSQLSKVEDLRQKGLEKEYSAWQNVVEATGKGFVDAAAGVAGIFNTLGLSGDPESPEIDTETVKEQTRQNIDKMRAFGQSLITQETPKEYQSLFKGKFTPKKLGYVASEAVAQTIPTVVAGLFTGGAGTALVGGGMGFNESKDIMKTAGLDDNQAEWAALGLSIPLGALEKYGADDVVKALNTPFVKKMVAEDIIKTVGKNATKEQIVTQAKKSLGKVIVDKSGSILLTGVKEGSTEVAQGGLQEAVKQAVQEYTGVDTDEDMSTADYLKQQLEQRGEEFVSGALGGSILQGAGETVGGVVKYTPLAVSRAIEYLDPEKYDDFKQELTAEVEQGIVTPEQADEAVKTIEKIQSINKQIPDNITDKDLRAKAVNLLDEKSEIQTQIEGKDAALVEGEKERIKQIDAELKQLPQEQKKVNEKEATTEVPTEQTEVGLLNEQENQKIEANDTQNIEGLPSEIGGGQELVETQPIQEGSVEPIEKSGILQKPQEEVVSETVSENLPPVVEQTTTDVGGVTAPSVSEALKDVEKGLVRPKETTPNVEDKQTSKKQQQLEIINKTNPAPNDYNLWVRKVDDIKTAEEAFKNARENGAMYDDFSIDDMQKAIETGEVTVYSSYPIENGVFVSTSKQNAQEYAGGKGGKLYSKKVSINDIAWLDEGEGQYAQVKAVEELLGAKESKSITEPTKQERVAERKAIAEAKVEEVADYLKDILSVGDKNVKKAGLLDQDKVIDVIASAVKALINTGIEIDEAIKQVRARLEEKFDSSSMSDVDLKQGLAKIDTNEARKQIGDISYRQAINIVNKYLRAVPKDDVVTSEEILQAYENKQKGKEREGYVSKKEAKNETKEEPKAETKERKAYRTMLNYVQNLPTKVEEYFKANPLGYEALSNGTLLKEAIDYIKEQGVDKDGNLNAYDDFKSGKIGEELSPAHEVAVGFLLRGALSDKYNALEQEIAKDPTNEDLRKEADKLFDTLLDLSKRLAEGGTKYGQGVQAYSLFAQNLTDEMSALFYFGKLTQKAAEKARKSGKAKAQDVAKQTSSTIKGGISKTVKKMASEAKSYKVKESNRSAAKKERDEAWGSVKEAFAKYKNLGAFYNPWEEAKKDVELMKALGKAIKAELKYKSVQVQDVIKKVSELLGIDEELIDKESINGIYQEARKNIDSERVLAMAEKEAAKRAINQAKEAAKSSKELEEDLRKERNKLSELKAKEKIAQRDLIEAERLKRIANERAEKTKQEEKERLAKAKETEKYYENKIKERERVAALKEKEEKEQAERIEAERLKRLQAEIAEREKEAERLEKEVSKLAKEIASKPELLEKTFEEIIEDFYTDNLDFNGLVDLIKDRLDVTDAQAKTLARKLQSELKANVRDVLSKQVDKIVSKYTPKEKRKRETVDVYQVLIRAQMMNVLNEKTVQDIFSQMFNIPEVTKDDVSFVKDMMSKYKQTQDPTRRAELIGKMMKRFNDKNPISFAQVYDAIWYANVLSGFSTFNVNISYGTEVTKLAYYTKLELDVLDLTKAAYNAIKNKNSEEFKQAFLNSFYGYWRSIFQLGTKFNNLKDVRREDTPLYETFNNVMSVMKYSPDVFLQENKGLDYNKRTDFNLQDVYKGKNPFVIKLLAGLNVPIKASPSSLNAVDLAFSTTIKNLFLEKALFEHYKNQGMSDLDARKAAAEDLFNDRYDLAEAQKKAQADRKLIDITVEEKNEKWYVTDAAKLINKTKSFDTKEEADAYVEKISREGTKYHKGVIDYINAKLPKPSVDVSRKIASRYLLTAEPEGSLGLLYSKYITKWKINYQKKYTDPNVSTRTRILNFQLDKFITFLRVPFNLLNLAIENSPIGFIRYASKENKIFYGVNRETYTELEKRIMLVNAIRGSVMLGVYLFGQGVIKAFAGDDDDENKSAQIQKRKQELLDQWKEKYPNSKVTIGDPLFELPVDGELCGSLKFLDPNKKKFLVDNGLAQEFSQYDAKANRWVSYAASPDFLTKSFAASISNYEKYVINDETKFSGKAAKKKEYMEAIKWAYTNMMFSYLNLSGLKSQQQMITSITDANSSLDAMANLATSSIQLTPALVRQIVENWGGVMRERLTFSKEPMMWIASKVIPIGGAFITGDKMYDMFGNEMPMVYGSKQGGPLGYYFDMKYMEKEKQRTELAQWLYVHGYTRYRDFAKEMAGRDVPVYENGSYTNKLLFDDRKQLKQVGLEAAKLAKKIIDENMPMLQELSKYDLDEVDYKSPKLKTPLAKAVDTIYSMVFKYKANEEAYKKGYLSKEAFDASKDEIDAIKDILETINFRGQVEQDQTIQELLNWGYYQSE